MRGISLHLCLQDDNVILDEVPTGIHDVLGEEGEREKERERGRERGREGGKRRVGVGGRFVTNM